MTIKAVFKSHIPSVSYFFKNGLQAAFLLGRYETDKEEHVQELQDAIYAGNPHIYVDPEDSEIDTDAPSPMERIRQEAYAQALADIQAKQASGQVDNSAAQLAPSMTTAAFTASLSNTFNVAAAADSGGGMEVAGVSSAMGAKLAALGAGNK